MRDAFRSGGHLLDLSSAEVSAWQHDLAARRAALARNERLRQLRPARRYVRSVLRRVTGARGRELASRAERDLAVERLMEAVAELLHRGEFDAAERLVLDERERQPGRVDLLTFHAELAMSARDWGLAIERWRRLMAVFGDGAPEEAQARLASALRSSGELDEAIRVIEDAGPARTPSGRVALMFEAAANLMASGDLAASAAHWRRLLDDPDLPDGIRPVVREALTSVQRASGSTPDPDLHPERILARDHSRAVPIAEGASNLELSRAIGSTSALRTTILVFSLDDPVRSARTRDAIRSWEDPSIDVRVVSPGTSAAAIDALRRDLGGDLLILLEEGTLLERPAFEAAREVFEGEPRVAILVADEDTIDERGHVSHPLLRSGFDPDLLLSQPSLGHAVILRSSAVDEARGLLDLAVPPMAADHTVLFLIWDLALRVVLGGEARLEGLASVGRHLPQTLVHRRVAEPVDWTVGPSWTGEGAAAVALVEARLREAGVPLTVELAEWGVPLRLRALHPALQVRVSIIIPTRDRAEMLAACVEGLLERTSCGGVHGRPGIDLEIVLVDNDSVDVDALELLAELAEDPRVRVVPGPGAFNFSRLINAGVAASSGEVLVLLNNDVLVRHGGWLIELVEHALRPDVGAVGALLEHHDGRVQHAGVLVGVNGTAEHAFREWPSDAAGYLALLRSVRRVSAVTAACLAVRRDVFQRVGGLDESAFPVELNDVDLCLRIEQVGLSVLWTPFARLAHIEGGTRGRGDRMAGVDDGGTLRRQEAQRSAFVERWRERIEQDPYYSPRLSTSGATYLLR